jgi:hypothetical protein
MTNNKTNQCIFCCMNKVLWTFKAKSTYSKEIVWNILKSLLEVEAGCVQKHLHPEHSFDHLQNLGKY